MRKLLMVALAAIFSLSFAASASAITAEPAGEITSTSLGKLTFTGGSINIQCNVVLNGSINAEIEDEEGAEVGSVTEGSTEACSGGTGNPRFPSAWPLTLAEEAQLAGEEGVVTINVEEAEFEVTAIGVTCLYKGTVPTELEASGSPLVTGLLRVLANTATKTGGSIFCPSSGSLSGSFGFTQQTLVL